MNCIQKPENGENLQKPYETLQYCSNIYNYSIKNFCCKFSFTTKNELKPAL